MTDIAGEFHFSFDQIASLEEFRCVRVFTLTGLDRSPDTTLALRDSVRFRFTAPYDSAVIQIILPWKPLTPEEIAGSYVLRRIGPPEFSREVPAITLPLGMFQGWILADTLAFDATGGASEVLVERRVNFLNKTDDTLTTRRTFTYQANGRVIRLVYACPSGSCVAPPSAILKDQQLIADWPEVDMGYRTWPRTFDRLGP